MQTSLDNRFLLSAGTGGEAGLVTINSANTHPGATALNNRTTGGLSGETSTVSAVPGPATVFGGILMVGALGWNRRRRSAGLAGLVRGTAGA